MQLLFSLQSLGKHWAAGVTAQDYENSKISLKFKAFVQKKDTGSHNILNLCQKLSSWYHTMIYNWVDSFSFYHNTFWLDLTSYLSNQFVVNTFVSPIFEWIDESMISIFGWIKIIQCIWKVLVKIFCFSHESFDCINWVLHYLYHRQWYMGRRYLHQHHNNHYIAKLRPAQTKKQLLLSWDTKIVLKLTMVFM